MVRAANFSKWKMMKSFWKADFPRLWWVQLTRGKLNPVGRQGVRRWGIRGVSLRQSPGKPLQSHQGPAAHGPPLLGWGEGVLVWEA